MGKKKEFDTSDLILVTDTFFVNIDDIEKSPFQPRVSFDEKELKELAENIRRKGQIQPIVLRHGVEKRFQLVCGERRWRAMGEGLRRIQIEAKIKEYSDLEAQEIALDENIKHKSLSTFEESKAFQNLWAAYEDAGEVMTFALMAKKLNVSTAYVKKRMEFTEEQLRPDIFELSKRRSDVITTCNFLNEIDSDAHRARLVKAVDNNASFKEVVLLSDITQPDLFNQIAPLTGKSYKMADLEKFKAKLLSDRQLEVDSRSFPDQETSSRTVENTRTGGGNMSRGVQVKGASVAEANKQLEGYTAALSGSIKTVEDWATKAPIKRMELVPQYKALAQRLLRLAGE